MPLFLLRFFLHYHLLSAVGGKIEALKDSKDLKKMSCLFFNETVEIAKTSVSPRNGHIL